MKFLSKKTQKQLLLMLAANHIIAQDALNKASNSTLMAEEDYLDALQHLTDNTCECASHIAGAEGVRAVRAAVELKLEKLCKS